MKPALLPLLVALSAVAAPAGAAELLLNGSFNDVGPNGASTTLTSPVPNKGPSAAAHWLVWNTGNNSTVKTDLEPSPKGKMIHVTTTGPAEGIITTELVAHPDTAFACVWVKVVRGIVSVSLGKGSLTSIYGAAMYAPSPGQGFPPLGWERLEIRNSNAPVSEFVIYSLGNDGAEFYVESASATPTRSSCEPT